MCFHKFRNLQIPTKSDFGSILANQVWPPTEFGDTKWASNPITRSNLIETVFSHVTMLLKNHFCSEILDSVKTKLVWKIRKYKTEPVPIPVKKKMAEKTRTLASQEEILEKHTSEYSPTASDQISSTRRSKSTRYKIHSSQHKVSSSWIWMTNWILTLPGNNSLTSYLDSPGKVQNEAQGSQDISSYHGCGSQRQSYS